MIPEIENEALRDAVRAAFATAFSRVWQVMLGIAAVGFLASLVMPALPLQQTLNARWAADDGALAEEEELTVFGAERRELPGSNKEREWFTNRLFSDGK